MPNVLQAGVGQLTPPKLPGGGDFLFDSDPGNRRGGAGPGQGDSGGDPLPPETMGPVQHLPQLGQQILHQLSGAGAFPGPHGMNFRQDFRHHVVGDLLKDAKRGGLDFSGGGLGGAFVGLPGDKIGGALSPETLAALQRVDTLGEQRRATPKGPGRRAVKKEQRRVLRGRA